MSKGARSTFGDDNAPTWVDFADRSTSGSLYEYNVPRFDLELQQGLYFSNLYINPATLDNIFNVDATSFQDTDQFICAMFHDIKRVGIQSVLGLPSW